MSARQNSVTTEMNRSGCNRGDEENPNSCTGSPSGTFSSSCDALGGPGGDVQTNVYQTVEIQIH